MLNRLLSLAIAPLAVRGDTRSAYAAALAAWLGTPDIVLTWKGRSALHVVCRALGIGPGDEVVVSAFSCVVVARAFMVLGARPVFVDIDPETFNTSADSVLAAIGPRTRLVVLQHTFGNPMSVAPVLAECRARGIPVVEDACHAFGASVDGRPAGTVADAGFFSTQWNKPFSTGFGGFLAFGNPDLAARVRDVMRDAREPAATEVLQLRGQLLAHAALVTPRTHGLAQETYRWLYSHGVILGSATARKPEDEAFARIPSEYFQAACAAQAEAGLFEAGRFDAGVARRRVLSRIYDEGLGQAGFGTVQASPGAVWSRYPVRVRNKTDLVRAAMLGGVELGTWFETPLHPIPLARHALFGMDPQRFPHALTASREVVNLPVNLATTVRDARRALAFLVARGRPV